MSKAGSYKYMKEVVERDIPQPLTQYGLSIARVSSNLGHCQHKIVLSSGEEVTVSLPNHFRRKIWIKRGDFVLVSESEKVKGEYELSHVLNSGNIKDLKKGGEWPEMFNDESEKIDSFADSEEENDKIFVNPNRYCEED
eukprot:Sdes_comp11721_c0_seq1m2821